VAPAAETRACGSLKAADSAVMQFLANQGEIMKTMIALITALSLSGAALAQVSPAGHRPTELKVVQAPAPLSEGEVRKVDKDVQKMTIKHGPLLNLDMPGMTMVFRVKDPAMLDQVKPGDKIKFTADKIGGAYTVTTLETAK
jgi:Cu(I)/Ag(I) efflux system periplasmic protein CusF